MEALQSAEKPFVGLCSIAKFIFEYIDRTHSLGVVRRHVKTALAHLIDEKVLKQKADSVRFAPGYVPEVREVRERKPVRGARHTEEKTRNVVTGSGRASVKRYDL
jgi:hypothetical protein